MWIGIVLLGVSLAVAAPAEPTVFIHGIKGSVLEDAEGDVKWLGLGTSLGLVAPRLELPLVWEGSGEQARDGLRATRVLDRVRIIPGLADVEIYGRFMKAMPEPFHPFAYDWRRDNLESVEKFEAFLVEIRARYPGRKLRLIAHSNGGLVSWITLNRHPEWFSSAWFAGVPFAGGVGFLSDLTIGTRNGLNSRVLKPAVLATFPSVYTFFRADGKGFAGARFMEAETWKKHRWGLFTATLSPDESARAEAFLAVALEHAARFRAQLVAGKGPYPELHVILSRKHPTISEAVLREDGSIDFDSLPKCEGDGRVCAQDALLPGNVPAQVHELPADHSELLSSPEGIRLLLR